jgi:gliding motility-associated-like protein
LCYETATWNPATCIWDVTGTQPPTADAGKDANINCTTSATLSASGGVKYSWSPAEGLSATNIANPIASPKVTTTYTVTVTAENGCTATDSVLVSFTNLIIANDDAGNTVNGFNGGIAFTNVLSNDLLNCKAVNAQDVTTSFVSSTNLGITLNGTNVVVAAGTPAGNYTLTYQICEIANPGNCDTADVTVIVSAPKIDAVNDNAGPLDGINGVKNILNVFSNDTLNNLAVNPTEVTLSLVATDPSGFMTLNPDGSIDIKDGTPAGTYNLTYSICEKLNPQNCDTAVVTVDVTCNGTKISGIVFNAGNSNSPLANVPITLTPINIVNGQNIISGPGVIQITNAQGYYNYTGIPAGDYVLQVQDANLNVAYDLYNVTSSFLVLKVEKCNYLVRNFGYDKDVLPVLGDFVWYDLNNNGLQDEWYDANNDGLVTKNIPNANGYIDSTKWEWIDFNGDNSYKGLANYGELNAAGFGNGTTNIPNLFITGPNGYSVTNTMGIQGYWRVRPPKDQFGIYTVELKMESNLSAASKALAATGLIKVLPGGPAFKLASNLKTSKTSSQTGTICGVSNTNPQTANVTAQNLVNKQLDFGIICKEFGAIDDLYANNTSSSSGTLGNVLTNDLLNGVYVASNLVNFALVSGSNPNISIDNLGNVNITSGTPAGTYVFVYSLCDKANASNCVNATVTVIVTAPKIVAQDDTIAGGNSVTGNSNAGNVLNNNGNGNDTLNGVNVTIAQVNLTVTTPATPIGGGTVPTVNTATGQISVPAGTPAGTYTIVYQICEKLNPSNCDTAIVTVTVTCEPTNTNIPSTACNADSTPIDLNSLLPIGTPTSGIWIDVNNSGYLEGSILSPLDMPIGDYVFEYKYTFNNCPVSIKINMNVNFDCKVLGCEAIVIHKALTPNNDGFNDQLVIDGVEDNICYPSGITVEIYNRWGILVFETSKYSNTDNYFDGYSRGRTTISKSEGLPTGTYFYILNYESFDNTGNIQMNKKEGFIYLSR